MSFIRHHSPLLTANGISRPACDTLVRSKSRCGRWVALATALLAILVAADRSAAATIVVNTFQSGIGMCSLNEAIYSANFHNNIAIDSTIPDHFVATGCVPGDGNDTILLPTQAVFQLGTIVDDAHNPFGPTATPIIFSTITIEANGARLEHVGNLNMRAFAVGIASVDLNPGGTPNVVSGTGSLTIRNAYIKGFVVKGGDGGLGAGGGGLGAGGGGLGAGGAIYLNGGGLTIENSTFEGNGAMGGNGGGGFGGGGGGGLSGNGGGGGLGSFDGGGGGGGGARGKGGHGGGGFGAGSGGGGTVAGGFIGSDLTGAPGAVGGFSCGGSGGDSGNDGNDGACPGGGGGGGGASNPEANFGFGSGPGHGGNGNYGGGGGGGGNDPFNLSNADGGGGGVGGGGGGGDTGGKGGYGGGGGASNGSNFFNTPNKAGEGGFFGGHGGDDSGIGGGGGGGAALGGAIFNHGGSVVIRNSTFTGNFVTRGRSGGTGANDGQDEGGAIFTLTGSLAVFNATISGNQSTLEGAGIVIDNRGNLAPVPFKLYNTILANPSARECFFLQDLGSVDAAGSNNLIVNNFGCPGNIADFPGDPQLGPLQLNVPGDTPTMAITSTSPAFNKADGATSLSTDQRGVTRPQGDGFDIGAYELCVNRLGLPCLSHIIEPTPEFEPLTTLAAPAAGGSVNPPSGIFQFDHDVNLTATTNPGYVFNGWTGAVHDPNIPLTFVTMDAPQTVTANFVPLPTTMAGNIIAKSGPQNARVWKLSLLDNGPGAANGTAIPSLTLTQTFGAACTPVIGTAFPLAVGNLAPAQTGTATVTLDFTGCAATARFTAKFTYSANGGVVSGFVIRYNQYE
jgi:uncharacterized repeat protein (TIGR02543 family)